MKEELNKRIAVSKARNPGYFNYIRRKGLRIEVVLCKLCRVPIRALEEVPTGETEVRGNKIIKYVRQTLMVLPNYCEILIEFDDGSSHATPLCKQCAKKPHSSEELEDIYVADMAQWEKDETGADHVKWDKLEYRKPEVR